MSGGSVDQVNTASKCHFHYGADLGNEPGIMDNSEAAASHAVMSNFDVFLNHRGPDVKATFVAHLEDALKCAGFGPFLDARSLMKGNPALKSIDQALDMAKVHVAVVSRGYADSKYCLNELAIMMRSGKPVIPVFYDVEPVDLRWVENGPFAEALVKHKSKGRTEKKVQEWTDALAALAGITGFCLADYKGDEAKLKREIVNEVVRLTPSNEPVEVKQYRVGLAGPTNSCIQVLENMGAGTGMLGLVGMGGVGKTTLAREIYNHFVAQKTFRCMTFLEIHRDLANSAVQVRPTSSRKLRKQLLWDLLRVQDRASSYSSWFQKVPTIGPVLIVVDDVHQVDQFEALVPNTAFLHPGSRIIVTSRDRGILINIAGRTNDHYLFDVSTLGWDESSMLFNWHAFQAKQAPEEYINLSKNVVGACGGLPLALKVIGSSLLDKRSEADWESIWREAIDALRQSADVMDVLRWSYDNLSESEKHMFVDITCLFYNQSAKDAFAYWESCKECTSCGGVHTPHTSLRNLINKNMVILDSHSTILKAHDLLKDLGQEIGRKAKSHFVNNRIAEAILTKNQGIDKTMALNLAGNQKRKFEVRNFANMPNLHFLSLPDGCRLNGNLRRLSKELRWLRWRNMPFAHIPPNLNLLHLISLDFSESTSLAFLWMESDNNLEGCPNLLRLDLRKCTSIPKLPDSIKQSSRLQYLNLQGCKSLKKLPESIGQLKALEYLILSDCKRLKALPESIGQLKALLSLDLRSCSSLKTLPDTLGALSNLQELWGRCVSLVKLPASIALLSNLQKLEIEASTACKVDSDSMIGEAWTRISYLHLRNCGELGSLVDYGALKGLDWLDLSDSTLTELPESFGLLIRLKYLSISSCERLQCLPNAITDFNMLESLGLYQCDNLKRLPKTLGALTSLKELNVDCCPIKRLPKSTGLLTRLQKLTVSRCKNLQKLPTSIRQLKSLRMFKLEDCGSIEAMGALTTLQGLPLWGNTSITKLPASLGIVSTRLEVYDKSKSMRWHRGEYRHRDACFNGTSHVLEEDESGFLKACHDESSGLIDLLRGPQYEVRLLIMKSPFINVVLDARLSSLTSSENTMNLSIST